MKNFKQIDKSDVWSRLQEEKRVYVVFYEEIIEQQD